MTIASLGNINDFYNPFFVENRLKREAASILKAVFAEGEDPAAAIRALRQDYQGIKGKVREQAAGAQQDLNGWHESLARALGYADLFRDAALILEDGRRMALLADLRDEADRRLVALLKGPFVFEGEGLLKVSWSDGPGEEDRTLENRVGLLFREANRSRFVLAFLGRFVCLFDCEKWSDRRYLAVDLDLLLVPWPRATRRCFSVCSTGGSWPDPAGRLLKPSGGGVPPACGRRYRGLETSRPGSGGAAGERVCSLSARPPQTLSQRPGLGAAAHGGMPPLCLPASVSLLRRIPRQRTGHRSDAERRVPLRLQSGGPAGSGEPAPCLRSGQKRHLLPGEPGQAVQADQRGGTYGDA